MPRAADLGLSVGSEQLQLVSRLGRAQGVSSLLRATPQLAPRRICHLPADLLTKHQLAPEQLWRAAEKDRAKIREVVFEVASAANRHLQHVGLRKSGCLRNGVYDIVELSV